MESGHRLHGARRRKRLTQAQLADSAGVSQRTVRRAEAGLEISDESLRCICAVLEIDCGAVAEGVDSVPDAPDTGIPGAPQAGPEPRPGDPMAQAMACHDPRRYEAAVTVPPSRGPTPLEYAGGMAHDLGIIFPFVSFIVSFMTLGMGAILAAAAAFFIGDWAWGCLFVVLMPFGAFFALLNLDRPSRMGPEVYAFRCKVALAVTPLALTAYAAMAMARPTCLNVFCGSYLLFCASLGVILGLSGALRLLDMRQSAKDHQALA